MPKLFAIEAECAGVSKNTHHRKTLA